MVSFNTPSLRDALALLLRSRPAPLVELEVDTAQLPARAVGQVLKAQLVAELPNGRSLLEMQGARYDVKLPLPARLGDTLQLKVLALEPRLTLALLGAPAGAAADQVLMSDSVRQLAAVLDRLSAAAPASSPPGATPAAASSSAAPVLAARPGDTAVLAEGLRTALTRSGLFYESHQAQWVAGARPLEELMREPQAMLKASAEPVHPQAIALVRQQLEVLDTRQLVWQGQVWPDQPLEWRIEEDTSGQSSAADSPPTWKTSLRLELPRLGEVTATLSIQGEEVRVAFSGLSENTRSAVRDGQVALRDALANAGLALREMRVERDET